MPAHTPPPPRAPAPPRFESGQVDTLVATDVAARGIDVAGITHVINYDMPASREDYVHRVGRTARAGASGTGVTFVADDQTHELVGMARDLGLHQALELGGFPSDATRGREERPRSGPRSGGPRSGPPRSRNRGRSARAARR
jgi:ATP-dependent RNA helicase RhlE